ncbi:hypothetical protein Pst134EB_010307 [Puccinia striiformis f. sp. tritici]|nr:hypothetical protein Pst134EB_010307 [Puccinia striiformis f. sp. tritici]
MMMNFRCSIFGNLCDGQSFFFSFSLVLFFFLVLATPFYSLFDFPDLFLNLIETNFTTYDHTNTTMLLFSISFLHLYLSLLFFFYQRLNQPKNNLKKNIASIFFSSPLKQLSKFFFML